jgi:hypothetical protein
MEPRNFDDEFEEAVAAWRSRHHLLLPDHTATRNTPWRRAQLPD